MGASIFHRGMPVKRECNSPQCYNWATALKCGDKNRRARNKPTPKPVPIYAEEFAKALAQRVLQPAKSAVIGGCQALKSDNTHCNRRPIVRYRRLYSAGVTPDGAYPAGEAVTQFCARHADAKDAVMRINWEREIIPTH